MLSRIIENLSFAEYKSAEALNASGIKTLLERPHDFANPSKEGTTQSQSEGRLIHELIQPFEPLMTEDGELFGNTFKNFYIVPFEDMRAKSSKEFLNQCPKSFEPVKKSVFKRAFDLAMCVKTHSFIKPFLDKGGKFEASLLFWIDGVPCKARPDYFYQVDNKVVCLDFKTITKPITARELRSTTLNYQYALQAQFYRIALKTVLNVEHVDFLNVWIENIEDKINPQIVLTQFYEHALEAEQSKINTALACYKHFTQCGFPTQWEHLANIGIVNNDYKSVYLDL